jgi:hypothetical protein
MKLLNIFLIVFSLFIITSNLSIIVENFHPHNNLYANNAVNTVTRQPLSAIEVDKNKLEYLQNVNVTGNIDVYGNLTVKDRINMDSLSIGDVTLDKTKLGELVNLPLVNLTSVCLRENEQDMSPICFTKNDIEFLKSIKTTKTNGNGVYVRWN